MEQKKMTKAPECNHCKFVRTYNYGKKIYYCDNEDRTDDIGKLGMDDPPEISPVWCPLKCKSDSISAAK